MVWSKIVGLFKQLDSHLSDAVYLHGCYLIGQEETFSHVNMRRKIMRENVQTRVASKPAA